MKVNKTKRKEIDFYFNLTKLTSKRYYPVASRVVIKMQHVKN